MLAVIPCDSLVMASPPLELKSENAEIKYQHSEVENYLRSGSYPEGADKRYKSGLRKRSKFFVKGPAIRKIVISKTRWMWLIIKQKFFFL